MPGSAPGDLWPANTPSEQWLPQDAVLVVHIAQPAAMRMLSERND
jgi:hypothetical protein